MFLTGLWWYPFPTRQRHPDIRKTDHKLEVRRPGVRPSLLSTFHLFLFPLTLGTRIRPRVSLSDLGPLRTETVAATAPTGRPLRP